MSNSIGGIGGGSGSAMMMQGMRRPDPAKMAENLFSKLDTSGQGYIQKSDLQTAFDNISSTSTSEKTSSVDELFSKLDTDSDGKVTKQEFSDTLKKVTEELDSQMMNMRMNGGMPPGGESGGLTKDQLTSAAKEVGSTSSSAASSIQNLANNFDQADTDGDGKVSFKEAMAYQQETAATESSAATASADNASSASGSGDDAKVMMQIMKLMHAYGAGSAPSGNGMLAMLSASA